ncbi:hypothetical protein Dalk_2967 [Desulfatibacillum aliphaticivorans]|uniref:Uncharacterized protein n=1 Tax=Desulfatibacillum aliphaticivorans TaxID=218208 RepID=B8FL22_DESAL|nr:hypothetical protein [Desulfatibacillum aliphaticivorans]ACL04657.1 hypothetical protein Dalk_2967 [Desulfatibacillum aliphaticivorans]
MNKAILERILMGFKGWNGCSMGDVLGVDPNSATADHVRNLGWKEVMQLFHAGITPKMDALNGEYNAEVLDVGVLAFLASFISHNLFGPGHWDGKGFKPLKEARGWGYNIFSGKNGSGPARVRKMNTRLGMSRIDDRDSFLLDYSVHNKGFVKTMRDEIRQINPDLFIGMGYLGEATGPLTPAPFILHGKPSPWKGPDE